MNPYKEITPSVVFENTVVQTLTAENLLELIKLKTKAQNDLVLTAIKNLQIINIITKKYEILGMYDGVISTEASFITYLKNKKELIPVSIQSIEIGKNINYLCINIVYYPSEEKTEFYVSEKEMDSSNMPKILCLSHELIEIKFSVDGKRIYSISKDELDRIDFSS